MNVFRLIGSIIRRHWVYFAIYLGILTAAAVAMGAWTDGFGAADTTESKTLQDETPSVAVVDRDGSEISRALASFVESQGKPISVDDSTFALQDVAAKDRAAYTLVIPAGYGQDLLAAADDGADAPTLETVVSYQSAQGALMDERTRAYASALYGFAASTDADASEIVAWADESVSARVPVAFDSQEAPGLPEGYLVYAAFSSYALFASISITIAVGLASLERTEVRRRLRAAPVASLSFGAQAGLACVVVGMLVWAVEAAAGLAAFGGSLAGCAPSLVATVVAAQLVYSLFAASVGYLLWRLHVKEEYANAVGNVFGLLFSFMGGAWAPLSLMGEGFQAAARFTPGFWALDAMFATGEASAFSEIAGRVVCDLGITALFAAAVLATGLAVGRVRLRERGA